jgi:hypothetical protein
MRVSEGFIVVTEAQGIKGPRTADLEIEAHKRLQADFFHIKCRKATDGDNVEKGRIWHS